MSVNNRNVGLFCALLLLLSLMIIPRVDSLSVSSVNPLDVQYYGEEIHGHIINRQISINGTNITVSGFTYNLNNTWPTANSTRNAAFPAIWVTEVAQALNTCLPVPEEVFWKFQSKGGKMLIFAADYNGTHYKEAVIVGDITVVWGVDFTSVDNKSYISYGTDIVIYEDNRTLFTGDNATSLYNPSYAVYKTVEYMGSKNWTFDNVTQIYLIPQEYVLEQFKGYEFVWSMIFLHNLNSTAGERTELTHFVVSPNGTILDVTHLLLRRSRVGGAYGGCNQPSGPFDNLLYVFVSAGGITSILVAIVLYLVFTKKKHQKPSINV